MKKQINFQTVFHRKQAIDQKVAEVLFYWFGFPRLLLEVFTRKNFGERYFSMSHAILVFLVLFIVPIYIAPQLHALDMISDRDFMRINDMAGMKSASKFSYLKFIWKHITWYIFIGAFIYCAYKRNQEIKRLPSVFNFSRFSLSTGEINSKFMEVKWNEKPVDERTIETIVEPLFFFIIGLLLIAFHQLVGYLIILASILYSISYFLAYNHGDHEIMDLIDKQILAQAYKEILTHGKDAKDTKGVKLYGDLPPDPNNRQKLADSFFEDEAFEVK